MYPAVDRFVYSYTYLKSFLDNTNAIKITTVKNQEMRLNFQTRPIEKYSSSGFEHIKPNKEYLILNNISL